nr:uncharacterized protein LOC111839470 isoform X2 [Paramormyrops kingsleyae]
MPTQENLSELATELQSRIPECLDDLSESPQNILLHNKCIGAIATYVFVNTGHRYSVVINMLPQEVTKVQVSGDKVVIHVKDHKTAGSFGRVNMALSKKEYQWLHQFAQLRYREGPAGGPAAAGVAHDVSQRGDCRPLLCRGT